MNACESESRGQLKLIQECFFFRSSTNHGYRTNDALITGQPKLHLIGRRKIAEIYLSGQVSVIFIVILEVVCYKI